MNDIHIEDILVQIDDTCEVYFEKVILMHSLTFFLSQDWPDITWTGILGMYAHYACVAWYPVLFCASDLKKEVESVQNVIFAHLDCSDALMSGESGSLINWADLTVKSIGKL